MRARIFAPENRKWWTLGARLVRPLHDHARQHGRERRAALDPARPGHRHLRARVDLQRRTRSPSACSCSRAASSPTSSAAAASSSLGLVIFTLASLACGLASSAGMLDRRARRPGRRRGAHEPATLSIISATFPPRQRGMAIGIWAGVSAMALAIGPLVGGLITQHVDWSWIFFINVPVGMLGHHRRPARHRRVARHVGGAAARLPRPPDLGASALFALTFALIEANSYGWTDPADPRLFAIAVDRPRRLRRARDAPAGADARPLPLQEQDLRGREHCHAARRARHVRRLLLHLALHAEHPRLLGRPDRRRRSCR